MDYFAERRQRFVAKDITLDSQAAQELEALGSRCTPTIVVDGKVTVGFGSGWYGDGSAGPGMIGAPNPPRPQSPRSAEARTGDDRGSR